MLTVQNIHPLTGSGVSQAPARYMSHVKPPTLRLGGTVGKVCDLEGESRLLGDGAVRPALSPAPCPHRALVFGEVAGVWASASLESLLPNWRRFQFIKSSVFQVCCAPDYGMLNCVLTGWSKMSSRRPLEAD